jgi:hypothetical protein
VVPAGADLYVIQMNTTGDVKVGRSKDVHRRLKQLQTGSPHRLRLIMHAPGEGHREREIHRRMERGRTRWDGEWFEEDTLAELPDDLYEKLLHIEDQDWWRGPDTAKALLTETPKPDWFDVLYEQGFWETENKSD